MINKEYKVDEIYNEDSYNAIKKLPSKCIDLIVIDPPYLIDKHGSGGAFGVRRKRQFSVIGNFSPFRMQKPVQFS